MASLENSNNEPNELRFLIEPVKFTVRCPIDSNRNLFTNVPENVIPDRCALRFEEEEKKMAARSSKKRVHRVRYPCIDCVRVFFVPCDSRRENREWGIPRYKGEPVQEVIVPTPSTVLHLFGSPHEFLAFLFPWPVEHCRRPRRRSPLPILCPVVLRNDVSSQLIKVRRSPSNQKLSFTHREDLDRTETIDSFRK